METPAETSAMLGEIATVGVAMAALITGIWGIMVAVSSYREKKAEEMETADLKEV